MGQSIDCSNVTVPDCSTVCAAQPHSRVEITSNENKSIMHPAALHSENQEKFKMLTSFTKTLLITERKKKMQFTQNAAKKSFNKNFSVNALLNAAVQKRLAKLTEWKGIQTIQDNIKVFKKQIINLENGAWYEGEWSQKGDQRHGKGKMVQPDGSFYEGFWRHDKQFGKGRFIYANGDIYDGDWFDGQAQGQGTYTTHDEIVYEGQYFQGKKHGKGKESIKDKYEYEGKWESGKKTEGIFKWVDGTKYVGSFVNDQFCGQGTIEWKDRRKYTGGWLQNKMHGRGKFTWPDGKYYDGEYFNDKRHGKGEHLDENNELYQGFWENGKQHGQGTLKKGNEVIVGVWEVGKLVQVISQTGQQPKYSEPQGKGQNFSLHKEPIKT